MKILAVETSGAVAGTAVVEDGVLKAEITLNHKMTHSQTIMPLIDDMKRYLDLDLNDVDYIACSAGPGSFTGLRIGAATAKGLAMGVKKPIVPVSTLKSLAYNVYMTDAVICPIIDARRGQVYTAFCEWKDGRLTDTVPDRIAMMDDVLSEAEAFGRAVIFVGDGIFIHGEKIKSHENFVIAPASCNMPRAASVASLAEELVKEGKFIDGSGFAPVYLRKSQAEREKKKKMRGAEKA